MTTDQGGAQSAPDTSADNEDVATPAGNEKIVEPGEQFPQHVPVPVEITDRVYNSFRKDFGEDEAASLQRAWGNNAHVNERIVHAVIENDPGLDQVYVQNQTENGALSSDGVIHALRHVLEQSGENVSSTAALAFLKKHPELEHIYNEHADKNGNFPITGLYRALHYIGKSKGYKFLYRGKR